MRRSTVMLAPHVAASLDRETAVALLEELQQLRRHLCRLRTIVDEVARLLATEPTIRGQRS